MNVRLSSFPELDWRGRSVSRARIGLENDPFYLPPALTVNLSIRHNEDPESLMDTDVVPDPHDPAMMFHNTGPIVTGNEALVHNEYKWGFRYNVPQYNPQRYPGTGTDVKIYVPYHYSVWAHLWRFMMEAQDQFIRDTIRPFDVNSEWRKAYDIVRHFKFTMTFRLHVSPYDFNQFDQPFMGNPPRNMSYLDFVAWSNFKMYTAQKRRQWNDLYFESIRDGDVSGLAMLPISWYRFDFKPYEFLQDPNTGAAVASVPGTILHGEKNEEIEDEEVAFPNIPIHHLLLRDADQTQF